LFFLTIRISYFLFAASLSVLSNEFASLYHEASYSSTIVHSIAITRYCARTDPQALRLLEILERFSKVVTDWKESGSGRSQPGPTPIPVPTPMPMPVTTEVGTVYGPTSNAVLEHSPSSVRSASSPETPLAAQIGHGSRNSSLASPPMPRPPLPDSLVPTYVVPPVIPGPHVNGMSPPSSSGTPAAAMFMDGFPTMAGHGLVDGPESIGDGEVVDLEGLWAEWTEHSGHMMVTGPPSGGIIAPSYPAASETTTAGESYGQASYAMSNLPSLYPINGNIPLYPTATFS
jgi:hypothetical protein